MQADWFFLSHHLDSDTPGFGGERVFSRDPVRQISRGDSSNSEKWTLNNHAGTHFDAPRHFCANGITATDFPAGHWVFEKVAMISVSVGDDEIISEMNWQKFVPAGTELILLKTGFEAHRGSERYWRSNPGVAPQVADWIRLNRPSVRAVGFDFISLTAFSHRALGREAHRAFLADEQLPIMIFEDLKLSLCTACPRQVVALPLIVNHADGAPLTIIGRLGNL